ncbi:uncharacterized protein LOC111905161 [Lactuca sativa]|uniref:uncharacterized protein LOC111905161 n=1 Tax=Lactuca sativa TaxID=4236 RepID=UPI0022AF63D4|nr:uncharacterized protein LOC111905161 [Lactuca sativa]
MNQRVNGPPRLNKVDPNKAWCYETIEIVVLNKVDELMKRSIVESPNQGRESGKQKGQSAVHHNINNRPSDMKYKQPSGSQKRKKRKLDEEKRKADAGALDKFIHRQPIEEHVEEHIEEHIEEHVEEHIEEHVEEQEHIEVEEAEEQEPVKEFVDIYDPRRWEKLNSEEIKLLVQKGPKRDNSIMYGPYDKFGRRFSAALYTRTLPNLEKCDREWLVYSKELDKVFCFCCKVFRKGISKGKLDGDGYADWHHVTTRVKEHEISLDHLTNRNKWFDMRKRLNLNEIIDKVQYEQFKKERDYWKQVLLRIIAVVKFLAKHNLAFRGSNEKLYKKGNGNFLGVIEMLEEFDPVIKEHVRRITCDGLHVHYLGHLIQNELISFLAQEIKKELIKKIKEAKYYSIILDCTPDSSHQEQMTIIVRYLTLSYNSVTVEESFLGFLNVDDTSGKGLFDITLEELQSLGLEIDDMRGQGYDNGANMKGKHQGVQKRFLDINPRAFYTPCGCHSLNLTLCDMAKKCVKGKNFFGFIQRIYTIFANSTKRWEILKDNVKAWSLKSLCQTRWESRVESVKAIKLQLVDVREALLQVGEKDNDAAIASEATSLAEKELGDFEFLVSTVIWYEVLNHVNIVSKKLQSKDMHLDNAIKEINKLIGYFKNYRETGFSKAIVEAKEIAIEMGIDPIFPQKRLIERKRRFEQFKEYDRVFGFLFPHNLRGIEDKDLKSYCHRLEKALKFEERSDIDADELYTELKLFETLETNEFSNPIDVLKFLKELDYFPNASIAYRILLTIPVTVASAEMSFSKLKFVKSYLRSTMTQERLSGLAMISIENEILESIDYEELINQFAIKNARRASRIVG